VKRFFVIFNIALLIVSNSSFALAASCPHARGVQGDVQTTHACCRAKHEKAVITHHATTEKMCGKLSSHTFGVTAFNSTQNIFAIERPAILCAHCLVRSNAPFASFTFLFDADKIKYESNKFASQVQSNIFAASENDSPSIASNQHAPPVRNSSSERIANCVFRI
jgi:hypothetical protein